MNKRLFFSLLATSILTACGGSSDNAPTETPDKPQANIAPIAVTDEAIVQNNEVLTLNVLSNDTDSDGDSLSLSQVITQPTHGTVAIEDNQLVYTPEENYAGTDSLTYQISDGALTSETSVHFTINHTMILSGKVTDSPIANANVIVEIAGEIFEATADSEGNYQLPIIINNMEAMLEIRATGNEDNEQANVELVVIAGGVEQLLAQVDDERTLPNEGNMTNVTHMSTATYLLTKDRNNGLDITSAEAFKQLKSEVSSEELMQTAAFIKLLIDNDTFDIPEGETVISALESMTGVAEGTEVSTADAIQGYLEANDLVDENGEPTEAFSTALAEAITNTLADPDVVDQFTAEMLSGKKMIERGGSKVGWHESAADGWAFNSDNTATKYITANSGYAQEFSQANWSINEGKLKLIFSEQPDLPWAPWFSYPFDDVVNYGFDVAVKHSLMAAVDAGILEENFESEMTQGIAQQTLSLLSKTDNSYQVHSVGDNVTTLIMPEGIASIYWQGDNPKITKQQNNSFTYAYSNQSLFANQSMEDIKGDWILSLDYSLKSYTNDLLEISFMGDKVTLTTTTASALKSGLSFASSLDSEGRLILTSGTTVYKINPIKKSGKNYLAITEKWVAGEFKYIIANTIAKFDDSFTTFSDNLVTEFPEVYLAHINSHLADAWNGDKLKLDWVWGYNFSADGSMNRGVSGQANGEDNWDGIIEDHFNLGDDRWTWDKTNNLVNFRFESSTQKRHRTWEVVSVDEQGRAVVFEHSTMGYDDNYDGEISADEIGQFIHPRINLIMKDDLSRWEDAWQNTIDAGLTNSALGQTSAKPQKTRNIKSKKVTLH